MDMPIMASVAPAGFVYHVRNQSIGRVHMFRQEADFGAFERVMVEAHARQPIRILSYLRVSIERGRPYGADEWIRHTYRNSADGTPFVQKAGQRRTNLRAFRDATPVRAPDTAVNQYERCCPQLQLRPGSTVSIRFRKLIASLFPSRDNRRQIAN
jgi:hypothetical protein